MDTESSLDHVFFPDSGVVSVVAVYADGVNVISWSGRASLFTFPKHTSKKLAATKSVMYITDNIPSTS